MGSVLMYKKIPWNPGLLEARISWDFLNAVMKWRRFYCISHKCTVQNRVSLCPLRVSSSDKSFITAF